MKKLKGAVFCIFLFFPYTVFSRTEGAHCYPHRDHPCGIVALNTVCDVYFDTLFTTLCGQDNLPPARQIKIPSSWNKAYAEFKGKKTTYGYATYRLLLKDLKPNCRYALCFRHTPASSCAVYIDGRKIYEAGKVSSSSEDFKPAYVPMYVDFSLQESSEAELVIQVANWAYRKGGIWSPLYFGEQNALYRYYTLGAGVIFFVCSMLLFLCIVCFTIFALNIKKRNSVYLGLFLFSLFLRMSVTGFNIVSLLFADFPYSVLFKLEYAVLWIAPTAFLFFLSSMFMWTASYKRLIYAYGILQGVLGFMSIVLPVSVANKLVPLFEIAAVVGVVFCAVIFIAAFLKKEKQLVMYFLSMMVVALALIYEIWGLTVHGARMYSFIPLSVLILAVIQFFTLAAREAALFSDRVVLIHSLKKLNDAYVRFVPREFLDILNKRNITDVSLGDHVQKDMGILFTQIYVQSGKEEIALEEQYDVYGTFSMIVSLLMPQYGGFVSKFLSRGIIALFSGGTQSAIDCCFEIQNRIDKLNEIRRSAGRPPVFVAMGVHYGKMILGTIGEISRLDDTVISDAVNTVARIESVSESLQYPLLVSLEAIEKSNLAESTDIALIPLGNIHVKGRIKLVSLFKCLPLEPFRQKLVLKAKISGKSNAKTVGVGESV